MAEKKKSKYKLEDINLDIDKLHTLSRLKEEGYDTSNKIKTINMDDVVKHDLSDELRNIVDMQKAIKANHSEIGWLLDGEDPKPERKEDKPNADEGKKLAGFLHDYYAGKEEITRKTPSRDDCER